MYIYVADADAAHAQALAAGATEEMPVMEMFWGDRMGTVLCPFGYKWSFATHIKDPTPEEMEAGAKAMMEQMAGSGDKADRALPLTVGAGDDRVEQHIDRLDRRLEADILRLVVGDAVDAGAEHQRSGGDARNVVGVVPGDAADVHA